MYSMRSVAALLILLWARRALAEDAPEPAGDIGIRGGVRGGAELHADMDPAIGTDLRLSFPLSPLTINPIFDYYVDEDRTLYQIGVNALYYLPVPTRVFDPYLGVGVALTAFAYERGVETTDDNGSRLGMNLIAGVCFDTPVLSPFAQVMVTVGEIDLVTIGAGVLFDFGKSRDTWDGCGKRRTGGRR